MPTAMSVSSSPTVPGAAFPGPPAHRALWVFSVCSLLLTTNLVAQGGGCTTWGGRVGAATCRYHLRGLSPHGQSAHSPPGLGLGLHGGGCTASSTRGSTEGGAQHPAPGAPRRGVLSIQHPGLHGGGCSTSSTRGPTGGGAQRPAPGAPRRGVLSVQYPGPHGGGCLASSTRGSMEGVLSVQHPGLHGGGCSASSTRGSMEGGAQRPAPGAPRRGLLSVQHPGLHGGGAQHPAPGAPQRGVLSVQLHPSGRRSCPPLSIQPLRPWGQEPDRALGARRELAPFSGPPAGGYGRQGPPGLWGGRWGLRELLGEDGRR